MNRFLLLLLLALLSGPQVGAAQVQLRLGDPHRTNYSDIHDGLRDSTPDADTVRAILALTQPKPLWRRVWGAVLGRDDWNLGMLALTRLAELRIPASADSVRRWRVRLVNQEIPPPPATDLRDLLPPLRAVDLELQRKRKGDQALLNDLIPRIPEGYYDQGDAWVFGRLGAGAADSIARRFLSTSDVPLRIRYLTLLSYSTDTTLIPLLQRIYVAPDSFQLPLRIGTRASDGLLWIGTGGSIRALLDARAAARARGTYADPKLGHADLDFLAHDSSEVVSRTGRWLTEWLEILK